MRERIRVLICDDHPVVRRGLMTLLKDVEDIEVVGVAGDGEEALAKTLEQEPDIVLMDFSMPGMTGPEATRRLVEVRADTRVVMLTSFSAANRIKEALAAGAVGYVLKDSQPEHLIRAIRTAAEAAGSDADV